MKASSITVGRQAMEAIWDQRGAQLRVPLARQPELLPESSGHQRSEWSWESTRAPHAQRCSGSEETIAQFLLQACPYGTAGDLLWIRETYWQQDHGSPPQGCLLVFEATPEVARHPDGGVRNLDTTATPYRQEASSRTRDELRLELARLPRWRRHPAITMPRSISRVVLHICAISVHRLHAISDAQILLDAAYVSIPGLAPRAAYSRGWDALHGEGAYERNDWVYVIDYAMEPSNIDSLLRAVN